MQRTEGTSMGDQGDGRVPVMRPRIPPTAAVLDRLHAIERSGQFSNFGPQEHELRARFAERLHVRTDQVATVSNATLGITGAAAILGGARWLTPSFTFAATPAALLAAGHEVVLGDVDLMTWELEPGAADVDGFVPVAPFGATPDILRWAVMERVVHDAAASLGADLDLSGLPSGHAVVFSLHATKVLGSGEGGIVVFGDEDAAARFRAWTNFGFAGSREAQVAGLNAKLSEIQAAYAHAALDRWPQERDEWSAVRRFVRGLGAEFGLDTFETGDDGIDPYWIVRFAEAETCDAIEAALDERGIETRRWWSRGCHRMPAYRHLPAVPLENTATIADKYLGLPFFRGLEGAHRDRLEHALGDAMRDGPVKRGGSRRTTPGDVTGGA
jgi:dTDP-4-amino-4,6-dideoxygalactose transaminase